MAEPAPAPTTNNSPVGPVASGERIDALDTIRGVALFGILLMNITAFGLPNAYDDPSNFGGFEGPSLWAWITYNVGRVTMAAGHLGVLLLLCRSGWFAGLMRALAAVGRMALTNYVSHTVFCVLFFSGLGLSQFGRLARHQLYLVVLAIWIFQLVASPIWLRYFRFGPLEWLWRSLTYVKKQPMKQRA